MIQALFPVLHTRAAGENIYILSFTSAAIAGAVRPGQFLNIRVNDETEPLLRRPFSVYHTEGDTVSIVFNIVGRGTAALSRKRPGDSLDVLGPLGVPFVTGAADFETGVLIAGGLGVAPMPLLTRSLRAAGKAVATFLGARTASALVRDHLETVSLATDDGSTGFHGTVVELAGEALRCGKFSKPRLFACGPTAMLRAVARLAEELDVPCEVSLEGPMACGFGICQGCPVELADGSGRYLLMCKDGPVFDIRRIKV